MKHISFMLTKGQILNRTKTVTRRLGWRELKPGTRLQAIDKGMGLKKGEKVVKLAVMEVVSIERAALNNITSTILYGDDETAKEGFPEMSRTEFVEFFCASHKGCTPESQVTRIEFKYVDL